MSSSVWLKVAMAGRKSEPANLNPVNEKKPKVISDLAKVGQISESTRRSLSEVTDKFSFRATDYYLGLIDWNDPADPIRRLIIPSVEELDDWGKLDPSDESSVTQLIGVQHKYSDTALLLATNACASPTKRG